MKYVEYLFLVRILPSEPIYRHRIVRVISRQVRNNTLSIARVIIYHNQNFRYYPPITIMLHDLTYNLNMFSIIGTIYLYINVLYMCKYIFIYMLCMLLVIQLGEDTHFLLYICKSSLYSATHHF